MCTDKELIHWNTTLQQKHIKKRQNNIQKKKKRKKRKDIRANKSSYKIQATFNYTSPQISFLLLPNSLNNDDDDKHKEHSFQ